MTTDLATMVVVMLTLGGYLLGAITYALITRRRLEKRWREG